MTPKSLYGAFSLTEDRHGERPAIRYIATMDQVAPTLEWNYRAFIGHIRAAANLFRACGVEADSSAALMVPNVPDAQVALFGAELAGRALPINPLLKDEHIFNLLAAADARVLVIAGDPERAERLKAQLPTLKYVFSLEDGPASFAAARARMHGDALDFTPATDPQTVVAAFHTGGTTGTPKLALHRQTNQLAVADAVGPGIDMTSQDAVVNALPLFHVAGSMCFSLSAIVAGACQVLCTPLGARDPDFIAKQWRMVENQGVTILGGVPTTIGALVPTIPASPPPALRRIVTGGAMMPVAGELALTKKLGMAPIIIYGMTECAGLLALRHEKAPAEPGWTGKAVAGMEIHVVAQPNDVEGSRLPPHTVGHVVARGSTVGPGYSDPALNATAFSPDGWLITGDLGVMDEEGNLRLTGRAKDLIIRSGHNIDPALIEEAAVRFPGVTAAAAVGAPDAYAGELPVLFVTVGPETPSFDQEALIAAIRDEVERPAVPKWVEVLDTLPVTAVGKVYKPALAARAAERTLAFALETQGLSDRIPVRVEEQNGVPHAHFQAAEEDHAKVEALMAPFTLSYDITPPST